MKIVNRAKSDDDDDKVREVPFTRDPHEPYGNLGLPPFPDDSSADE